MSTTSDDKQTNLELYLPGYSSNAGFLALTVSNSPSLLQLQTIDCGNFTRINSRLVKSAELKMCVCVCC